MLLVDPADSVEFKPNDDGPTYRLRVPRVVDRAKYLRAIQATGARFWSNPEFIALCKTALGRLLAGDDQADALKAGVALMDAYVERLTRAIDARRLERTEETEAEFGDALPFPKELEELVNAIGQRDQGVAKAAGDNAVYWLLRGIEAARLFLAGWDRPEPFRGGLAGPTEETLALIPNGDFAQIGLHVDGLLEPTEARMGNSGSPSSGSRAATDASADGKTTPPKPRSKGKTAGV